MIERLISAFIEQGFSPVEALRMAEEAATNPERSWSLIGAENNPKAKAAFGKWYGYYPRSIVEAPEGDQFRKIASAEGLKAGMAAEDANGTKFIQRMPEPVKDERVAPRYRDQIYNFMPALAGGVGMMGASMLPGRAEAAGLVGQIPSALAMGSDMLTAGSAIGSMYGDATDALYNKFLKAKIGNDELYYGD